MPVAELALKPEPSSAGALNERQGRTQRATVSSPRQRDTRSPRLIRGLDVVARREILRVRGRPGHGVAAWIGGRCGLATPPAGRPSTSGALGLRLVVGLPLIACLLDLEAPAAYRADRAG
jgi:hypothetical protein